MTHMEAEPWIRMRLLQHGVLKDGGKWKANFRGTDVGIFNSQAEALKAYRQAAEQRLGDQGAFPTDAEIDATLARGDMAIPPQASSPAAQPATQPKHEPPKHEPPKHEPPKHEPHKPAPRNTRR